MPARLSLGRDRPGQCSAGGVPLPSPPLESGGVAVPAPKPDVWSGVVPPPLAGGDEEPEEGDEPVSVPEPGAFGSGAATPPDAPVLVCGGAGAVVTGEPLAGEPA